MLDQAVGEVIQELDHGPGFREQKGTVCPTHGETAFCSLYRLVRGGPIL